MINPVLLDRLVCPITRTALVYDAEKQELTSDAAGLAFPVRNGVAIMLMEEARPIAADAD